MSRKSHGELFLLIRKTWQNIFLHTGIEKNHPIHKYIFVVHRLSGPAVPCYHQDKAAEDNAGGRLCQALYRTSLTQPLHKPDGFSQPTAKAMKLFRKVIL